MRVPPSSFYWDRKISVYSFEERIWPEPPRWLFLCALLENFIFPPKSGSFIFRIPFEAWEKILMTFDVFRLRPVDEGNTLEWGVMCWLRASSTGPWLSLPHVSHVTQVSFLTLKSDAGFSSSRLYHFGQLTSSPSASDASSVKSRELYYLLHRAAGSMKRIYFLCIWIWISLRSNMKTQKRKVSRTRNKCASGLAKKSWSLVL